MKTARFLLSAWIVFGVLMCAPPGLDGSVLTRAAAQEAPGTAGAAPVFEDIARPFLNAFDQICVQTNVEPGKIGELAEALGWARTNERSQRGTGNASWISSDFGKAQAKDMPLMVLELVDGRNASPAVTSCTLSTWGLSSDPKIAKDEVLALRKILSETYTLGEVDESEMDLGEGGNPPLDSDLGAKLPKFRQFKFLLSRSDRKELSFGYQWIGGVHRIRAQTNAH